jgi:hypothetical protein
MAGDLWTKWGRWARFETKPVECVGYAPTSPSAVGESQITVAGTLDGFSLFTSRKRYSGAGSCGSSREDEATRDTRHLCQDRRADHSITPSGSCRQVRRSCIDCKVHDPVNASAGDWPEQPLALCPTEQPQTRMHGVGCLRPKERDRWE